MNNIFTNTAYAQEPGLVSCNINCNVCDAIQTLDNILRFAVEISFIIAVALIVWAAITIMTSGGNSGQVEKGKKMLRTVLIGIVIVLVSWVFVHSLLNVLAGRNIYQEGFRSWTWDRIPCRIN